MAAKQGDIENNQKYLKEQEQGGGAEAKDDKSRTSSSNANFEEERNLLLVVAAVIATVTYQAALAPPPSIWKEGENIDYKCLQETWRNGSHSLRQSSLLRDCPALKYFVFMFINTLTLSTSVVSIFLLLTSENLITTGKVMIALSIIWLLSNYTYLIMSLSPDLLSAMVLCVPIYLALPFFVYLLMKYWIQDIKQWKKIIGRAAFRAWRGTK